MKHFTSPRPSLQITSKHIVCQSHPHLSIHMGNLNLKQGRRGQEDLWLTNGNTSALPDPPDKTRLRAIHRIRSQTKNSQSEDECHDPIGTVTSCITLHHTIQVCLVLVMVQPCAAPSANLVLVGTAQHVSSACTCTWTTIIEGVTWRAKRKHESRGPIDEQPVSL